MEEVTNKTVIALKSFSTGSLSMFKGEIREMDADMAETLIDNGLVAEYVPDVPAVGANDKDKYLHTNAETGEKEWASVGGTGGGVLVVKLTYDMDTRTITLDKTWQEIKNADAVSILMDTDEDHREHVYLAGVYHNEGTGYGLDLIMFTQSDDDWVLDGIQLHADSASDYPVMQRNA